MQLIMVECNILIWFLIQITTHGEIVGYFQLSSEYVIDIKVWLQKKNKNKNHLKKLPDSARDAVIEEYYLQFTTTETDVVA